MPIHPDYHEMLRGMTEQYCDGKTEETTKNKTAEGFPGKTCQKALSVFYATCKDQGLDYTKPRPKSESKLYWVGTIKERGKADLSWAGDLSQYPPENILHGVAIHPVKTFHPEEWPSTRVYLDEELEGFSSSLKDTPLVYDHIETIPEPYKVLAARYNDGQVEYVAYAPDEIVQKVRDGKIKHVSIEYNWEFLQNVNGAAPRGMKAAGLGILERFQPGDPATTIKTWEAIVKHLKEAKDQTSPIESKDLLRAVVSELKRRGVLFE